MDKINWNFIYILVAIALAGMAFAYYKYVHIGTTPDQATKELEEEIFDVPEELPQKKPLSPHEVDSTFD